MKTKIVFFLANLNGGGAERVTVNILRQLDFIKFEVKLVLVEKTGLLLELIPRQVELIDLQSKKTMFSILKLRRIISHLKPDILFSTLHRTHIALDIALYGFKNKPKLIYRSPTSPKHLLENGQLNGLMKKLLERSYENADSIIVQTPEMKEEMSNYHNIELRKISVLLNPLDRDLIDKKTQNIQNPFETNHINVVAAGRLSQEKGFDILIKSFKKVIDRNNKFRLYIIGKDHGLKFELKKLSDSLDLSENVFFLGFQTNPYRYYYYSDLFVLSSRWEGLPNTILENLYIEKPIIATRCIPFMDSLIKDGQNGILTEINDEDALAKAILEYKKINVKYKTIDFNSSNIDNIFKKYMV